MESSYLSALPIEVLGMIFSCLDRTDIASLRLTCKHLDDTASRGVYAALFKRKTIRVDTGTLQRFVDVTSDTSRHVMGQLQDCTLVDVVEDWAWKDYNNKLHKVSSGRQRGETESRRAQLLAEAFSNLNAQWTRYGSHRSGLDFLRLRVAICTEDGRVVDPSEQVYPLEIWRITWDVARRLFRVAMSALATSRLAVNRQLDLFHGQDYCNLGCDLFIDSVDTFPWTDVFGSLQSLKINASSPVRDHTADPTTTRRLKNAWSELYRIAGDEDVSLIDLRTLGNQCPHKFFQGVLRLLYRLPNLQVIDLRWRITEILRQKKDNYYYRRTPRLPPLVIPRFTIPRNGSRRPLQSCTLSGFQTGTSNLMQFLQITQPAYFSMRCISLKQGTFDPIFDFMTGPETAIEAYFIEELYQGYGSLNFNVPGPAKLAYEGQEGTPVTLSRQEDNVKLPISYHIVTGRPERDWRQWVWIHEMIRLYDPPRKFH